MIKLNKRGSKTEQHIIQDGTLCLGLQTSDVKHNSMKKKKLNLNCAFRAPW